MEKIYTIHNSIVGVNMKKYRLQSYFICMYADELNLYYKKVKPNGWNSLTKSERKRITTKAIENGIYGEVR